MHLAERRIKSPGTKGLKAERNRKGSTTQFFYAGERARRLQRSRAERVHSIPMQLWGNVHQCLETERCKRRRAV